MIDQWAGSKSERLYFSMWVVLNLSGPKLTNQIISIIRLSVIQLVIFIVVVNHTVI